MGKVATGRDVGMQRLTVVRAIAAGARAALARAQAGAWPARKYQQDPEGYAREILGVTLLPHQVRFLEAIRDGDRVAVRSGQKCGKTFTVCVAALWLFDCFDQARVIITANSEDQIKNVLWKELKALRRGAVTQSPGTMSDDASKGLQAPDGREIIGMQTRQIESLSGISGKLMYIVDEASALTQSKFEALEGNTMGGGKLVMISNPTRTYGPFFDAFYAHRAAWRKFHWSSRKVALYVKRRGLKTDGAIASMRAIAKMRRKYGEGSTYWLVRVEGEFPLGDAGKIIPAELLQNSHLAYDTWTESGAIPPEGRLNIGVDCAGEGIGGDKWAFAAVRGTVLLREIAVEGLTVESALAQVDGLLAEMRRPGEIPRLVVDIEGGIGSRFYGRAKAISEERLAKERDRSFFLYGFKASAQATRDVQLYDTQRDELWANGRDWLSAGGCLPADYELEAELSAPQWIEIRRKGRALQKVTPKKDLRSPKMLGRSTDKADAFLMAIWVREKADTPQDTAAQVGAAGAQQARDSARGFDPYASRGTGGFDPYGRSPFGRR